MTEEAFGEKISPMRGKLLALIVLAPWLFYVACQPLAELTVDDQTGNVTSVTNLWWVTEALLSDDPKGTPLSALCWEQPGDVAFDFVVVAVFGPIAGELGALGKVVKIHERVRVYLI